MFKLLQRSWKSLIFKGVLLFIYAIVAFAKPEWISKGLLVWIGALFFLDGLLSFGIGIREWKSKDERGYWLLEGIMGVGLGLFLMLKTTLTLKIIGWLLAIWFLVSGINRTLMSFRLEKGTEGKGWLLFNGILAAFLGLLFLLQPLKGPDTLVWLSGLAALLLGIALVALGFKFRKGLNNLKDREIFKPQ